jgi:NADPH:quinone reductase-like Zn-dependent oxidoreductase
MRATIVRHYGGPEQLDLVERPTPEPGPGQVRVAVAAAAVNPVDAVTRAGFFDAVVQGRLPIGLGWDLAGTVDAVGSGIGDLAVGDPVIGLIDGVVVPTGAYATHAVLPREALAPAPAGVDLVAASTVPLNASTADQALELLDLAAGQTLLVTGAAGAVGEYAVALAAGRGLKVIGLARPGDEDDVRAAGAADFVTSLDDVRDVDAALDAARIGTAALASVRDGGSFLAVTDPDTPPAERGIRVLKVSVVADADRLARVSAAAASGQLRLRVAGTFPLTDAGIAQEQVARGGVRGRYVLIP